MNALEELAARKRVLLERSESERADLARVYYKWSARSQVAGQALGILRNPLVLAGLGLLALKMPWRKAFRLGGWAFKGFRLLRLVQRMRL